MSTSQPTPGSSRDIWSMIMPARLVPAVMLVCAAVIYGITPSFNRYVGDAGLSPFAYAFWFSVIGALIALVLSVAASHRPGFSGAHVKAYVATGLFGVSLPFVLLTYAAPHLPVSVVGLVLALNPAFTYVLALVLRMNQFRWLSVAGLALGLGGVFVIVGGNGGMKAGVSWLWLGVALLAPMSFAMANVLALVFRPPASPSMTLSFGLLVAAAALLIPALLVDGRFFVPWPLIGAAEWSVVGAGAVMAIFIYLFFEIVYRAGPVFFSQFNYLSLVAVIAWAIVLFGEMPDARFLIALALIVAGVFMVNAGIRSAKTD